MIPRGFARALVLVREVGEGWRFVLSRGSILYNRVVRCVKERGIVLMRSHYRCYQGSVMIIER